MELRKFLVEAKKNTYASGGERKELVLNDGSKEFIYRSDSFEYRDRYLGFNPFIGEEIVHVDGKAVWGMNYYGTITSKDVDASLLYQFLKRAMSLLELERPFRGPNIFSEKDWRYEDESKGDIDNFSGKEVIYFNNEKVYELKYHGGFIFNK